MNVAELIAALRALDPQLPVYTWANPDDTDGEALMDEPTVKTFQQAGEPFVLIAAASEEVEEEAED